MENQVSQKKQYAGLTNHGATCYMNTLLQTLFMTGEFRDQLFKWEYDSKFQDEEDSTPLQLQILFSQMVNGNERYQDTKSLIKSFQWPQSEQYQQNDIQEFTRLLFQTIEISCKSTWLQDVYQGSTENYVHCNVCGNESIKVETFQDLSMTVRNIFDNVQNSSLEQALKYYIKPEKLEGDNSYFCEQCQKKQEAIKGTRFKELPPILTFVISRFELDFETFMRKKINHFMHFPYVLNMNKFLKNYDDIEAFDPPKELKEKQKEEQSSDSKKRKLPQRKSSFDEKNSSKSEVQDNFQKAQMYENSLQITNKDHFGKSNDDSNLDLAKHVKKSNHDQLTAAEQKIQQKEDLHKLKQSQKEFDKIINNTEKQQNSQQDQEKQQQKSQKKEVKFTKNPALIAGDEVFELEDECFDLFDPDFNVSTKNYTGAGEEKSHKDMTEEELKKRDEEIEKQWQEISEKQNKNQIQVQKEIQEYIVDGEFVYELYAINIHSGGAMGGHYFSYIKSFENNTWNCFDDTRVNPIYQENIENSYGVYDPKFNSGSSAYMLSYRKVKLDEKDQKKQIFCQPCEPPKYIEEMTKKKQEQAKIEYEKEQLRKQEQLLMVTLKVSYNHQIKPIDLKRTDTLQNLMDIVQIEHNVIEDKENWRLRLYSPYDKMMKDTYTDKLQETLESLNLNNMKTLVVEVKKTEEKFVDYDPLSIQVNIVKWVPNLLKLDDDEELKPVYLNVVPQKTTVLDLMKLVEQEIGISIEKQVLLKRKTSGEVFAQYLNLTEDDKSKVLEKFDFYNTIQIFLEEKDESKNSNYEKQITKRWETEFEMDKTRCIINFNYPIKAGIKSSYPEMTYTVSIDNRKTMKELKQKIAEFLEIKVEDFIIKKNGIGKEIRDLDTLICNNAFRIRGSIMTQFGTPSRPGEISLQFILASQSKEISDKLKFDQQEIHPDLNEYKTHQDTTIYELKQKIAKFMFDNKITDVLVIPEKIRLREKAAERLGQILHNDKTIKEQIKVLYDKKQLCLTLLEQEEITCKNDLLVYSRIWDVKNFELTPPEEIMIQKDTTLGQFGDIVAQKYGFKVENLEAVSQMNIGMIRFERSQILDIEDGWKQMLGNVDQMQQSPWYCSDGHIIIFRNNQMDQDEFEKLKQKYGSQATNEDIKKSGFSINTQKATKKYVPEKAMKIGIKKKEDTEQEESNSNNDDSTKNNEDSTTMSTQTENNNNIELNNNNVNLEPSADQEKEDIVMQQQQTQITQTNTLQLSILNEQLESQKLDCLQIPEIQSIQSNLKQIQQKDQKQQVVIWEVELKIHEKTSFYYNKNLQLVVIFEESYLNGQMPIFGLKNKIFHPNISQEGYSYSQQSKNDNNNNSNDFKNIYDLLIQQYPQIENSVNINLINPESIVQELEEQIMMMNQFQNNEQNQGMFVSMLINRILQLIDSPVVIGEENTQQFNRYINNLEAAKMFQKNDTSNFNLKVQEFVKKNLK